MLGTGYPITDIYLPLKWCGFAYKLFESVLGNYQYYPKNSFAVPKNGLFGQFHAPQTNDMKEEILQQLTSPNSTVRVVFATIAMGMGYYGILYNFCRRQVGLEEMGNHQQLYYTTITGISLIIKLDYKNWLGVIVKVMSPVLGFNCSSF